jgi:hypothetical protein
LCGLLAAGVLAAGAAAQKKPEGSAWNSAGNPPDLTGTWTSGNGDKVREFRVYQRGSSVSLGSEQGEDFKGTFSGGSLEVSDKLSEKTVNQGLPDWVKQRLIGQPVTIKGTLNQDGHTISAKFYGKREHWETKGDQKVITGVEDVTFDLPLEKEPDRYYIADWKVDYSGWQDYVQKVREKLDAANAHQQAAEIYLNSAKKALDEEQLTLPNTKQRLEKRKQALLEAGQVAIKCGPDESQKTDEYRQVEKDLGVAQVKLGRARKMYEDNQLPPGKPAPESAKAMAALMQKKYEEAKDKVEQLEARLKELQKQIGFTRDVEAARARAAALIPKVAEAQAAYDQQVAKVAEAQNTFDKNQAKYTQTSQEFSEALAAVKLVQGTPVPRFRDVRTDSGPSVKFHAELWSPDEALRLLDPQIRDAAELVQRMDERRHTTQAEFLSTQREAIAAMDAWADSIMTSALLQAGVETCYYASDIVKASKAGPVGILAELSKKCVENWLSPTKFYEADVGLDKDWSNPALDLLPDNVLGVASKNGPTWGTAEKRVYKTLGTGDAFKAVAAKYNLEHDVRVLQEAIGDGGSVADIGKLADKFEKSFTEFEKAKTALNPLQVKGFLKANLTSYAEGAAKDITKEALKQMIGELVEGETGRDYMLKEMVATGAARFHLVATSRYWKVYDKYQDLVNLRTAILEGYDRQRGVKVDPPEWFRRSATLYVTLKGLEGTGTQAGGPGPNIKVWIGGRPLRSSSELRFVIDSAEKLKHDGNGGVVLDIRVTP